MLHQNLPAVEVLLLRRHRRRQDSRRAGPTARGRSQVSTPFSPLSSGEREGFCAAERMRAARARVLAANALAGLNTLLLSYSRRAGASAYSFSRQNFSHDVQRTSFAFSFSTSERKRIQQGVFSAALAHVHQAAELGVGDGVLQAKPAVAPVSARPVTHTDLFFNNEGVFGAAESGYIFGQKGGTASGAVPPQNVVAARLSLPPRGGPPPVPLLDLLPPDLRPLYASPGGGLLRQDRGHILGPSASEKLPKMCLKISEEEYPKLLEELYTRGMLTFREEVEVVNGLFAVPKNDTLQRLIADLRRANFLMVEAEKVELVGPDTIARVQVQQGVHLRQATRDIRDFYHRLLLPEWLWPFFAWPAVALSKVPFARDAHGKAASPERALFPCLTVLPMGWSHSVLLAQRVHERVIHHSLGLRRQDQILSSNDLVLRKGRLLYMIFIDDTWWVSEADEQSSSMLDNTVDRYEHALDAAGFPDKASKRWGPESGSTAISLGMAIDGKRLSFGMSAPKLERLKADTRGVLRSGKISGRALASLAGRWNWAFLARRLAMSTFAAVYLYIRALDNKEAFLWESVRKELEVACAIAPLLRTRLDLPWSAVVAASDASSYAGGIVSRRVSDDTHKHVLPRAHAGLLRVFPPFTDSAKQEAREQVLGPLLDVSHGQAWTTNFSRKWDTRGEHINSLEMRAAYVAFRKMALQQASTAQRHVLLVDNTVTVAAITKGRCSSRNLLVRLRPLAVIALATGAEIVPAWVETSRNPSDKASRLEEGNHREICEREEEMELQKWVFGKTPRENKRKRG